MAEHDKANTGISYSSLEPTLRRDVPAPLKRVGGVRHEFDQARDPFIRAQINDLAKTERARRDEGDGSRMVKRHKPFPELRPKHDLSQIRKTHNQQVLSEHRQAQMKQFAAQEQNRPHEKTQNNDRTFPERERSR